MICVFMDLLIAKFRIRLFPVVFCIIGSNVPLAFSNEVLNCASDSQMSIFCLRTFYQ